MGRSVSEAADKAVQKSVKKEKVEKTPGEIIRDIRGLLDAKMAVPPDSVRVLLAEYDRASASNV